MRCRVDPKARVCYRRAYYSAPVGLVDRRGLRVRVDATHLQALDGGRVVAHHRRLQLDHYLEILLRKPGALAGSTPLAQARAVGSFTVAHEIFWVAADTSWVTRPAPGAPIEVLLGHPRLPAVVPSRLRRDDCRRCMSYT